MAITDVQQALINAGTIAKGDLATVSYSTATTNANGVGTVESQGSWFGGTTVKSGFSKYEDVVVQPVAGDTTGTEIQFYSDLVGGTTTTPTVGTIVAYDQNYVLINASAIHTYYMIADDGLLSATGSASDNAVYPITDLGTTGSYTAPASLTPVCYVEGSRIRTPRGEIPVENLREGDQVSVMEGGREITRPVIWIGYREVNLAAHHDPYEAQPIRIRRDALAPGQPCRDLLVSPDHAIYLSTALLPDGVLVPVRLLVNGATIVRETRLAKVRYYHVELDRHSIIFAENLLSESYLDTGNRSFFQNGGAVISLNVGFVGHRPEIGRDTHSCAPFIFAPGSVRPLWQRLADRAEHLGYEIPVSETTDDPGLRLCVDGRELRPLLTSDRTFRFALPPDVRDIRLLSRAARPCDTRPWIEDHRRLGLSIDHIRVGDGQYFEEIALDGPALGDGWWGTERDNGRMWRWTNGDASVRLPVAGSALRMLEVSHSGGMTYPLAASADERSVFSLEQMA